MFGLLSIGYARVIFDLHHTFIIDKSINGQLGIMYANLTKSEKQKSIHNLPTFLRKRIVKSSSVLLKVISKKVPRIEKLTHIWTSDEHVSKRCVEDAVFLIVDGRVTAEADPERFGSPEPQSDV